MRIVFALLLAAAGVWHFVKPEFYAKIVPPPLPAFTLVYASGLAAVAAGVSLLFRRTARFGAWASAAFFAAVFPANLYLAFHPEIFPQYPAWFYWARLPLQAVFILWALRYTRVR